jgi:hypothetical protein
MKMTALAEVSRPATIAYERLAQERETAAPRGMRSPAATPKGHRSIGGATQYR